MFSSSLYIISSCCCFLCFRCSCNLCLCSDHCRTNILLWLLSLMTSSVQHLFIILQLALSIKLLNLGLSWLAPVQSQQVSGSTRILSFWYQGYKVSNPVINTDIPLQSGLVRSLCGQALLKILRTDHRFLNRKISGKHRGTNRRFFTFFRPQIPLHRDRRNIFLKGLSTWILPKYPRHAFQVTACP